MAKNSIFNKPILVYLKNCIGFAWKDSISIANNFSVLGIAILGITTNLLGVNVIFPEGWQGNVLEFFVYLGIAWAVIFVFRLLFVAPYSLFKEASKRISDLSKVDWQDLQHMLGGLFFEGTFFYNGRIFCGEIFKGKDEILRFRDDFIEIPVRAPKNAIVNIKIQFLNGRQETNSKCHFYYRDQKNESVLIRNIYEEQKIYLNEKSCFYLKLAWGQDYALYEEPSLEITISSWTK